MKHTRTLERVATALAIAAIAAGALALVWRPASGALAPEAVAEASGRLASAVALRRDVRRDDQFDAIVGSLAAGVHTGDGELAGAVERVRTARERERAAGTRGTEVDAALDELAVALGRESAAGADARGGSPAFETTAVALGAAAAALAGFARRARRRETEALRAALDVARRGPARTHQPVATEIGSLPVAPVFRDDARAETTERPAEATPFGTLIEVVAVDDESTGENGLSPSALVV